MDASTLLFFIPACFALNMAPGPNNLLSISNATHYGFSYSCFGGIGRLIAFAGMIFLASLGLAVILQTSAFIFYVIKFAGVAYLFWLAYQLWVSPTKSFATENAFNQKSIIKLARQEFFVAAGNPKAILIFTAFLPQFINPSSSAGVQFVILGSLFLLLEFVAIMLYALLGLHMKKLLTRPKAKKIFNRACSGLLTAAGIGLLFSQRAK
ncbi:LysE family translocator [Providencia rettgeri]|uniref:LysE family translocator n=2 Tax=Enterobacterales TaxID=91347 RepID=UPI0005B4B055|nr:MULTISPECIES: LysE family translocator [Morganellaceae]MBG5985019.1 LysE family translocator [Proteus vulgaris]MBN7840491.1 LysE family translocator [Providencia rettgeri]MBN7852219.1 LysE family translocator [Providencia rettgeri]MBN7860520.1 LysE family translocator [Providencia rettgeri]MBN7870658.1 LysE family translocator [Providencia rettgeri]